MGAIAKAPLRRNRKGLIMVHERVREYVEKLKRAKTDKSIHKYRSMIANQVGYESLSTGKSCVEIRKEWDIESV